MDFLMKAQRRSTEIIYFGFWLPLLNENWGAPLAALIHITIKCPRGGGNGSSAGAQTTGTRTLLLSLFTLLTKMLTCNTNM